MNRKRVLFTSSGTTEVPLGPATVAVLRDYLSLHLRADDLEAPLFLACSLRPIKATGKAVPNHVDGSRMSPAEQAPTATVARAAARLVLHSTVPVVQPQFLWHGVPACGAAGKCKRRKPIAQLQIPLVTAHLRRPVHRGRDRSVKLSKFMGHANTNVTLGMYAHLFEDGHTDAMAAFGADWSAPSRTTWCRCG